MTIFTFNDYKLWFRALTQSMPNNGRGQLRRVAEHLNISPTIVTQVFSGDRELLPDHAILLAEYLGLSKLETRFLLLLVNRARAGTPKYRAALQEEIEEARKSAQEIKSHVARSVELTEEAKLTLYSNWYYLAIWSLVAIGGITTVQDFAKRLAVSPKKVADALQFLKKFGLVKETTEGKLEVGHTLIHLESDSPQIPRHHQSWRLKAFQSYELPFENNLMYTAPVTLSKKDAVAIREKLLKLISEAVDLIKDSPSEELYCLCMDWYKI